MLPPDLVKELAYKLYQARKTRTQLRHLSRDHPQMTIEDGYAIQREWVKLELAFVLERRLRGPGVTLEDVLQATAYVTPALEIIDARIEQFDRDTRAPRKVFDTIADFAANAGVVAGGRQVRPDGLDLRWVGAMLYKNTIIEETGLAAGVLNHPATGVAWLANKIARYDEELRAGDLVLSGSFTRPTTAERGDTLHADFGSLGTISVRFA